MNVDLTGVGLWLPDEIRGNDAWPDSFSDLKKRTVRRELIDLIPEKLDAYMESYAEMARREAGDPFLGAERRRVAPNDVPAYQAEVYAGEAAIQDAGLTASDIDTVLAYSSVPDKPAQPSAPKVAHELGIGGVAYGVDAGCASTVAQMQVACSLIQTGQAQNVLLCQSNLAQRVAFPGDAFSPSMGDAATAMVLSASPKEGLLGTVMETVGSEWESICWMPRERNEKQWFNPSTGGWTMGTERPRKSVKLMASSVRYGVETVNKVLDRCGVSIEQVDLLAATQARDWMPGKIAEGLGLPPGRAPSTYRDFGSVGPCTPLLNFWTARESGLVKPGSLCVLYVQGISFTVSAALFRWRA